MKKQRDTVRITLDLGPKARTRLERLQGALDASKVSVIRRALELLEKLASAIATGHELVLVDKDGNQQKLMIVGLDPVQEEGLNKADREAKMAVVRT